MAQRRRAAPTPKHVIDSLFFMVSSWFASRPGNPRACCACEEHVANREEGAKRATAPDVVHDTSIRVWRVWHAREVTNFKHTPPNAKQVWTNSDTRAWDRFPA